MENRETFQCTDSSKYELLKPNVFCDVSGSGRGCVCVTILVSLLRKGESHKQWHTLNTQVTLFFYRLRLQDTVGVIWAMVSL